MLTVQNVNLFYGAAQALRSVSLTANIGRVTCLLGRNGVGKTSLLRAICGLQPIASGSIPLDGQDVSRLPPYDRARRGVALVPQGREIFPLLTVKENLETGFAPGQSRPHEGAGRGVRALPGAAVDAGAAAAATCRAASSSSSPSAARSPCGPSFWCSTSRPRASSRR